MLGEGYFSAPFALVFCEQLLGDNPEGICRGGRDALPFDPSLHRGVHTPLQQSLGIAPAIARHCERNLGIDPDRQQLLFAGKTIRQAPQFSSRRLNEKE